MAEMGPRSITNMVFIVLLAIGFGGAVYAAVNMTVAAMSGAG
jgi:CHASE3 domain sensor protein